MIQNDLSLELKFNNTSLGSAERHCQVCGEDLSSCTGWHAWIVGTWRPVCDLCLKRKDEKLWTTLQNKIEEDKLRSRNLID